ncbi:hypothetical protein GCM10027074_58720 [Streptomyces deserti]
MERVSIANGWRAAKPGSRNVQAPRVRSNCPYPGREGAAEFFDEVTVDATARAFLPPGSAARSRHGSAESCPLARTAVDTGALCVCGRGVPAAIRSRQLCVRQSWFDLGDACILQGSGAAHL